jgi:glycosyltransferase involved in cell wall biosynthesis
MSDALNQPLRICYFGTYRDNYSRNQIMIGGLRRVGVEVIECHETLWHGIEDRVQAVSGGWLRPVFWMRVVCAYARLLHLYRKVGDYDVMVLGYPGILDVFLGRILTRLRKKPLVWDVFMSVYLIALERDLDRKSSISIKILRFLERQALRVPDMLIQDTREYVAWFAAIHGISPTRFRLVPTGADDSIFQPIDQPPGETDQFRVLYYGSFIPNHGVEYIVEAANLLRDEQAIQFELIGNGPERDKALRLMQQYDLTNVEFVAWLDKSALLEHIAQADVCLGAFGITPQSMMTVQNKIYEATAMAKPLISGDSDAISAAFEHGLEIYLCKREDSASLADAIRTLWQYPELRKRIAENGYQRFKKDYGLESIGHRFKTHLHEVAG